MSWWSIGWEDDSEEAERLAAEAAQQAANLAAAKDYVSKEASRLEAEYTQKYSEAQSYFSNRESEMNTQFAEKNAKLDEYAKGVEGTIQIFNQAGRENKVAAKNVGTPTNYSVRTQPVKQAGPSPMALAIGAGIIYYAFFMKGR